MTNHQHTIAIVNPQAEYIPRAESIAAANFLDERVVEDRYADRLKVVNFQPVKDERMTREEMTASGVAVC